MFNIFQVLIMNILLHFTHLFLIFIQIEILFCVKFANNLFLKIIITVLLVEIMIFVKIASKLITKF
jgi:hypothetical protein